MSDDKIGVEFKSAVEVMRRQEKSGLDSLTRLGQHAGLIRGIASVAAVPYRRYRRWLWLLAAGWAATTAIAIWALVRSL